MLIVESVFSLFDKTRYDLGVIARDFDRLGSFAGNGDLEAIRELFNFGGELGIVFREFGVGRIPTSDHRSGIEALFHVPEMSLELCDEVLVL